jgi:hypothetical protein
VDPIRPFANLIRSLRASRAAAKTSSASETSSADPTREVKAGEPAAPPEPLEQALQARLPRSGHWDSRRAREIFVEHALSRELGTGLAGDPAFTDLVADVSGLIEQQPEISARLDVLLKSLAQPDTGR